MDLSGAEAWVATTEFMENFGFSGCVYGRRVLDRTPTEDDIRFSNQMLGWRDAYMEHKDYERDPLFIYAPDMPVTFFTGAAFVEDYPYLQQEDLAVIRRAETYGITSGIALKLSDGSNGVLKGWNLLGQHEKSEMIKLHADSGSLLLTCAALADQRIRLGETQKATSLSSREVDCLSLLASGLRNDQIGDRLNIKPVTVEMHLRNARTKLDARTREQALAIAISTGMVIL
ncbi:MAG: LuxR C-terminal-related transcriptional regulator [Pseudomonadota bacterium]